MPKVLLAGGGTAGHVNPLLATASALSERGFTVECLGTASGLEAELIPAAGYGLHLIPRLPLPRRPSMDLVRLPGKLRATVKQVRELLTDFDLAVGFGGFVSTPLYLAARGNTPLVIHEQNAKPGLANKLGARWADAVGVTFAGTPLRARHGLTETVGLPLRPQIAQLKHDLVADRAQVRAAAAQYFGLDPQRFTLLVTGGSLGAAKLNETMIAAAAQLPPEVQVIHLTGKGKDQQVRAAIKRDGYVILDYLVEMEKALGLADAVVSRCGAGTVAELSSLGLPALYVPLPIGNGEQRLNARAVVAAGGGRLVADAELDAAAVLFFTRQLLDPQTWQEWSTAASSVAPADPTAAFVELIEKVM